jgi:hypothetical protein
LFVCVSVNAGNWCLAVVILLLQFICVHQLWLENRDGGLAAAATVIADNLPGGWTDKQVCMLANWFADTVYWSLDVVILF